MGSFEARTKLFCATEGVLVAERGKRGAEVVNQEQYKTKGFGDRTEVSGDRDLSFAQRYNVKTTKLSMCLEFGIIGRI